MVVSKHICKSRLLVNGGFEDIKLFLWVMFILRKGGRVDLVSFPRKLNVRMLAIKIIKKLGDLVSRMEN